MAQAAEKKSVIQWERYSNFKIVVNTRAYITRAFSKYKPATFLVIVEEKEKAQAIIFMLLQREQFSEGMKSLKVEKKIPKRSKILQFTPFLGEEGLIRTKGRIGKNKFQSQVRINFKAKHSILLY